MARVQIAGFDQRVPTRNVERRMFLNTNMSHCGVLRSPSHWYGEGTINVNACKSLQNDICTEPLSPFYRL